MEDNKYIQQLKHSLTAIEKRLKEDDTLRDSTRRELETQKDYLEYELNCEDVEKLCSDQKKDDLNLFLLVTNSTD